MLALLAPLALAACDGDTEAPCPGEPAADLAFEGELLAQGDPRLAGGLDPDPSLPDCDPVLEWPQPLPPFTGELTRDGTGAAALCRERGNFLFGRWSGAHVRVETSTGGAVLGACDPTCAAGLRLVVSGDLEVDGMGAPVAFQGALVEILVQSGGTCGACAFPCAARYALTGAP
jgi:hypothetical protein